MEGHITTPLIEVLIQHDLTTTAPGQCAVPPHRHPFHQLDIILQGSMTWIDESDRSYKVHAGEALLIPPLAQHSFVSANGFRQSSFKIVLQPIYWGRFPSTPRIQQLSAELFTLIRQIDTPVGSSPAVMEAEHLATATLCLTRHFLQPATAISQPQPPPGNLSKLLPALLQIAEHPFQRWSIEDLSKQAHLTPDTFTRCFSTLLRQTPRQFLSETKIRAAARLLQNSSINIKELADLAGYTSVHSFTKAFTRIMGTSPARYRQRYT